MKDAHEVVIVFSADIPSHRKEMEMWYSCLVQQQSLWDTQCMLIAHHKPGSGDVKGSLSLSPPLNKLKLVHLNLEDDAEETQMEFINYLKGIINSMSESRDREMSIMTQPASTWHCHSPSEISIFLNEDLKLHPATHGFFSL
ncbi:intraflagellar transport protein 22 homolog [Sapajus apella]|uniref:Intraflagellar transport protein 22 homolog n=1 Tax=Sapajus apella TaxID=9515 RepID=A0A6J3HHF4_SAPAP|nr:intraflagellar transport protein 22 homolog [Sapajus apella]XP_032129402.1 intraflagellar transport protein 22 homolog [Sapajus apella]